MSYNCPKCRDTKRLRYTRRADAFSNEVTVYERCECDTDAVTKIFVKQEENNED